MRAKDLIYPSVIHWCSTIILIKKKAYTDMVSLILNYILRRKTIQYTHWRQERQFFTTDLKRYSIVEVYPEQLVLCKPYIKGQEKNRV